MMVLDASVLIAHLDPADAHHGPATSILVDAAPDGFLVHPITLAEVLVGGVRIGKGAQMRADLEAAGVRLVGRDADEPLRLAELRVATGLRMPDCCVVDAAVSHGAGLASFDQALVVAARRLGVPTVP